MVLQLGIIPIILIGFAIYRTFFKGRGKKESCCLMAFTTLQAQEHL